MADSCSIYPHVRNSKGEMVESRLFKDLLHHLSNRGLAKEYYAVGTNDNFLQRVGNEAKFDENGEITISSLIKAAKIDVAKEKVIKTLNDDIGAGVYSYNDAIGKLQNFNRTSPFNEDYMATISSTGDGSYRLQIVEKTAENEGRLIAEVSNRTLQDRILYSLREAGVDVSFIEADEKVDGKYSTKNAKQTANGLYQLIQVAKGKNIDSTLAEEAGHFAVGALGKSPLVQRLQALLTPEVQKKVLGDDYDSKSLGTNSAREVAGTLVGKALIGELKHSTPGKHLLSRIADVAKKIFATIKGDEILKAGLEADEIAERIARDFLSPNFSGSVEQALETEETLYSAKDSVNVATFKKIAKQMELLAAEMRRIDDRLKKKFDAEVLAVTAGRDVSTPSFWSDATAFDGIIQAVESMIQLLPEMQDTITSVDFSNDLEFYNSMPTNAKKLRVVETYLKNSRIILEMINNATSGIASSGALVTGDVANLRKLASTLDNAVNGGGTYSFCAQFKTKQTQFFLKFMENQYGSQYVERAARKVWKFNGTKWLVDVEADRVPLSDYLDYLSEDISWYESLFASMSNSPDIVGQIADKTTKQANKWADDLTQKDFEELRMIKAKFDSLKLTPSDMRKCYEVGRDGKLSGYFISSKLWGEWEKDFKELRKAEFENFKALNPDINSTTLSQQEKDMMWEQYFAPIRKAWHKSNSTFNPALGMYEPKDSVYHNSEYDRFVAENPELSGVLRQILALKEEIDKRLPEGMTRAMKAPQFRGTFTNEIGNRNLYQSTGEAIKETLRRSLSNAFVVTSEDRDFGNDLTYGEGEDLFETSLSKEKEKLSRVPTYGISLLPDMNELSTDFFHSMLSYAGMANTYAAMNKVVDTLEVGREVIRDRKVEGMASERQRETSTSKAFTRYGKFMEKQVYGIGYQGLNTPLQKSAAKIGSTLSSLAAKVFLGGNVIGGLVNLGTGVIEVLKEAGAGEFFNMRDWKKANAQYFKSLPHNLWDTGKLVKDDKVSLLMTKFNMLGDNKRVQREWHTNRNRVRNFFGNSLMIPYKSGDHYMQTMAYLAMLNGTKVFDSSGNEMSLWDAYEVVDIDPNNPDAGKKIAIKDSVVFKDVYSIDTYNTINSIISKIDASLAASTSSPFGGAISLTTEEQDYLDSKGYNLADMELVRKALIDDAESLTWNTNDETVFMDKAREINNRMHGIYNNQDKVAFQQNVVGNMLLAMRGYALGMIERRFGRSKYSATLGGVTEGSMNTLGKVVASMFTDDGGFKETMKYIFLPTVLGDSVKADMEAHGFSANQYYNMRRNFGDMIAIAALALLKYITKPGGGGDDDEDKLTDEDTAAGLVYYFSSRLFREQSAFNLPTGMLIEKNSLLDLNPAGLSVLVTLYDMAKLGIGQEFADEDNPEYFYQSSKEGMYEKGDSKFEKKFYRMFPYLRSWYVVEHPYSAMESYDYGQRLRQR